MRASGSDGVSEADLLTWRPLTGVNMGLAFSAVSWIGTCLVGSAASCVCEGEGPVALELPVEAYPHEAYPNDALDPLPYSHIIRLVGCEQAAAYLGG
jgi:hypothetical protein